MIGKIALSLLIGVLVGGIAYVALGFRRRDGSNDSATEKHGTGGKSAKDQKKEKKKRPTDNDDDSYGGRASGSGLTPTKEWVGGSRG